MRNGHSQQNNSHPKDDTNTMNMVQQFVNPMMAHQAILRKYINTKSFMNEDRRTEYA